MIAVIYARYSTDSQRDALILQDPAARLYADGGSSGSVAVRGNVEQDVYKRQGMMSPSMPYSALIEAALSRNAISTCSNSSTVVGLSLIHI